MLCPKCGLENPEDSGQCSNCRHKFRFGHAYHDPQNIEFIASNITSKPKILKYAFFLFLIVVFGLLLLKSF